MEREFVLLTIEFMKLGCEQEENVAELSQEYEKREGFMYLYKILKSVIIQKKLYFAENYTSFLWDSVRWMGQWGYGSKKTKFMV